jgi:hypothetical protein
MGSIRRKRVFPWKNAGRAEIGNFRQSQEDPDPSVTQAIERRNYPEPLESPIASLFLQ